MKKNWPNNLAVIGVLLLLSAPARAQQKNEFTIKQAVAYATKNATQVKNALLDEKIQEQINRQITATTFPQLSTSIGGTHYFDIPVSILPGQLVGQPAGTTVAIPFGTAWNATGSLDASQLLFDGQVFVALQARGASLDLYKKTTEVTQEQIKANVYKIYYQLVVGNSQIASVDANIDRFEKLLHDTKEIYKNGFAEKLDVDKVTVQLNNLKTEKEKLQNSIAAGNCGLKFLMGMPQKEQLILTDTLSEDELKANILEDAYDYKNKKEFQLLTVVEALDKYNIRRYKLSKLPTLSTYGTFSKNAQRNKFDFFDKGDWFTTSLVGLKISIPLFDGNKKNALIRQSKYELEKAKNNLEQLKQNIDYNVEQSRIKMKSALITLDNQKQNIVLAEKVYNTTKKKYEQGLGSNQEIYEAHTELKVAQTNYYNSLYDAIIAKIDWLTAAGKL